jgi:hypothetical protein
MKMAALWDAVSFSLTDVSEEFTAPDDGGSKLL